MSYKPRDGYPRVVPVLAYADVAGAIDWLTSAFGFREVLRWTDPSGVARVAELDSDGGAVMLESREGTAHSHGCHYVLVLVDAVDEHFERAREAGAKVIAQPEDKPWGLRQYTVEDPGGHRWEFSQHLRDVRPEDWGATPAPLTSPATR
jgi:uncharacterized glyoxalase superfamily protein PhnB